MSCCKLPRLLAIVTILVAAGVCIWQFAPWEAALSSIQDISLDDVLPDFNLTDDESSTEGDTGTGSTPSDFVFNQCEIEVAKEERTGTDSSSSLEEFNKCCNGLSSNCDFRVNELMFATIHNAMSTKEDGFFIGANHLYSLEKGLKKGYRGLLLDVCDCSDDENKIELVLCHGVCIDSYHRDIIEVLENIVEFLKNNPGEVLLIDLEMSHDDIEHMDKLVEIMDSVEGFMDLLYDHPSADSEWPVMGDLVNDKKNIILFQNNGADCSNQQCGPGIHMWYDFVQSTSWEFNNAEALIDFSDSCQIKVSPGDRPFFNVNHFVTPSLPSPTESAKVNTDEVIEGRLKACMENNDNIDINLVSVDFWSMSNLPMITQTNNKAKAERRLLLD
mmetsp:Transcript_35226/g.51743  ORF Transcript_35226/g.51743 Transcript_35226/m.51743 type:complete len:387 (+) Transcript_35226:43-1203(+)|eukprot:CAMPEP_0195525356 /NCGR_PEP_ID=MMETSP0794_2-20130614/25778_1 /TAXON_ID=515487 /ORGANISM="Stephanopyxis turris, Strain CCMP 815" /LENGTH=386 /DNA_ID=CAMNT_0040655809 /DNA_START=43 /DNA_END=1203 /DNA_ORIENTATION=-